MGLPFASRRVVVWSWWNGGGSVARERAYAVPASAVNSRKAMTKSTLRARHNRLRRDQGGRSVRAEDGPPDDGRAVPGRRGRASGRAGLRGGRGADTSGGRYQAPRWLTLQRAGADGTARTCG